MSDQKNLRRMLRWFDPETDEMMGEAVLDGLGLEELQRMFGVESGNPMFDSFPVGAEQAVRLAEAGGVGLEMERFEYFVETDAVDELNAEILRLLGSPHNTQAFADLASLEENWRRVDKGIKVPRNVGMHEGECPGCFETVRLIFDKFGGEGYEVLVGCPHCRIELRGIGEFGGYTTEVRLEEV